MAFNWIHLIIILIPIAVWIFSNLAKNQREEARRPGNRLPPQPAKEVEARPKQSNAEIERFLEEVRRRRGEKSREEGAPRRPVPAPPPPRPQSTPPRKKIEPQKPPRPLREEDIPMAVPIPVGESQPAVPFPSVPPQVPQTPAVHALAPVAPVLLPQTGIPSRPIPPAVKNLLEMVGRPDTLRAAFLLKEVLGPPLSRKPHRRSGWTSL